MADCIKIAIDFVSAENIDRCEKLTKEFREQNQSKVWKDDMLQLRMMMWFAWQSCSIGEAGLDKEAVSAALAAAGTAYRKSKQRWGEWALDRRRSTSIVKLE
jgi:[histone H3]-dimethyl-L-lysine9 demethylase